MICTRVFLIFFLLFNTFAEASPCKLPAFQQFDFWLGSWEVKPYDKDSNVGVVGKSKISKINDGCTLLEEYETPSGYKGKSLNIYDAARNVWHQTWTDNTGMLLQLEGNFSHGKMVLVGDTLIDKHEQKVLKNKITWSALSINDSPSSHTVRQVWETSTDNGATWKTVFDGEYFSTNEP